MRDHGLLFQITSHQISKNFYKVYFDKLVIFCETYQERLDEPRVVCTCTWQSASQKTYSWREFGQNVTKHGAQVKVGTNISVGEAWPSSIFPLFHFTLNDYGIQSCI